MVPSFLDKGRTFSKVKAQTDIEFHWPFMFECGKGGNTRKGELTEIRHNGLRSINPHWTFRVYNTSTPSDCNERTEEPSAFFVKS